MNRENRPRRGRIFIEYVYRKEHSTPTGSHLSLFHIFYNHAIPSGLIY